LICSLIIFVPNYLCNSFLLFRFHMYRFKMVQNTFWTSLGLTCVLNQLKIVYRIRKW
jgi:hypothetical protein